MTRFKEQRTEEEAVGRAGLVEQMEDNAIAQTHRCGRWVNLGLDVENISLQDTQ